VRVCWTSSREDTAEALREHGDAVAAEVLAVSFTEGGAGAPGAEDAGASHHTSSELGLSFILVPATIR
jgi:isoleucyl-tRNA synthetase